MSDLPGRNHNCWFSHAQAQLTSIEFFDTFSGATFSSNRVGFNIESKLIRLQKIGFELEFFVLGNHICAKINRRALTECYTAL